MLSSVKISAETPAIGPSPTAAPTGVELKLGGSNNAVPGTGATGNGDIYTVTQSDVTAQVAIVFDGTGDDAGIVGRYQDSSNYWYIDYDSKIQYFLIQEKNAGSFVNRAASSQIIGNDTIKAIFSGSSIQGSMQAAGANLSYTSSDFQTSKGFGIACGLTESAANGEQFSAFKVTNP